MKEVSFTVRGKPAPAGSKRGFVAGGRVIITDANPRSKPWMALVQDAGFGAVEEDSRPLIPEGPVRVTFDFQEVRPKGHYNSKGELNAAGLRKPYPTKAPDLLKLARAIEDALSGVCYRDDSQIVTETLRKRYGDWDGVFIHVASEV